MTAIAMTAQTMIVGHRVVTKMATNHENAIFVAVVAK